MKKKLHLLIGLILMTFSLGAGAQTLVAGDIVILGISVDTGTPVGEFCWMPLINLNSGTVIYFTDAGWNDLDNAFMGATSASESLIKYTVPAAGVLAGVPQVVSNWTGTAPTNYQNITGTRCGERGAGFNIPNSGDQIIVFTSALATNNASFGTLGNLTPLFAATTATMSWTSATGNTAFYNISSSRNNVSNLPDGLTDGQTALAVGTNNGEMDESDNIRYEGVPVSGSRAVLLAGIANRANWGRYDNTASPLAGPQNFADLTVGTATGWTHKLGTGNNYSVSGSDNIKPVCQSITLVGSPAANATSVSFTVTFDETVSNVTTGDFTVSTVTGNASGTVSGVSGSGASYTVTVNTTTATAGSFRLNLNANTDIIDAYGNGNGTNGTVAAFTTGGTHTMDRINPTVTISSAQTSPTNVASITINILFSESVTGFDINDVTVSSGTKSNFSGSGNSYSLLVAPTVDGAITVGIAANVAVDAAANNNNAATNFVITSDRTSPTVSISGVTGTTNAASIPLTITFSESVTGFVVGDITVSGGTLNTFAGSGTTYTVNLVPTTNGTVSVNISGGVATDGPGNGNAAAAQYSIVYDNVQPTVSITAATPNPTNSNSIPVTVTFSESVINFIQGDVTLGNCSINSFSGTGTTYTFNVVPSSNGTITVNVNATVATDTAGNANTAATQLSRTYDSVAPGFPFPPPPPGITNLSPFNENITLTESSTDFTSADVQITNGTLSSFSGSGTSYTVSVTPTANGTVTVTVAAGTFHDAAGNANTAALNRNTLYDNTQPTVTITSAAGNPTNSNIPVTVTFSESVTNFVQGDVVVGNGTLNSFSGSGTTYTFTVVPTSNGTVTVNVAAGVATDQASNTNTAATQFSRVYDNTQPTVSLFSAAANPTNAGSIGVTVTFSESVSNFVQGDVSVVNGTINSFSGTGTTYTFNVVPTANGTVTVDIAAGVASDSANNSNTAATQLSRLFDNVQPTVSITSPATTNPTNANSFVVNVTFSESVTNFVVGDIVAGNGSLSNFSGSGSAYAVTVTPTADGTVTVNVAAGVADDSAGNTNTVATQYSVVSDKNGPTVSISSSATNPTNLNGIPVTFTFSESVADFVSSDVFVSGGTLSGFTGSGTSYSGSIAPSGDGTINVFVFGGVATDAGGNGNTVGTFSIVSDRTRPTVSITSPQSSPTSTNPIVLNINFSEPVINFVQSDIAVTGGSLSGFSGSGASYTVNLTPSGTGNKTVNIAANVATDFAGGNNNFAATQFTISYTTPCSQTTTWNGLFWTNGDPVATQPAVIAADYNSWEVNPEGFSACSLIIGNSAQVFIGSGANVTISGNLTVQAGSTLTFENNANLLQSGVATTGNSGSITMKRNATMIRQDYVYWSSPVAGQNLFAFSNQTLTSRFYEISETTNAFLYVNPLTNSFQPAKGYAIRAPDNYIPNVPTAFQGVFTGVPLRGNISIPITHNSQGFNLIGNPYPSTISADAFLAANSSISTIYYWTHSQQSASSGANYATYNATGGAAASNTVPISALPNGTIQVGQGFVVQTNAAGSAVFSNAMRVINNDDQFYRTSNDTAEQKSRLWLNLSSAEGAVNQILLGYVADATNAFDHHFDGKLVETQGTKLYNVINDSEYVIQGRALPFSDTDVVPLGFKTDIDGTYKISLDHVDGLFSDAQDIFIKDNLTGVIHNIKLSDYSFAATAGTYHNRFEVVYQNSPLGTETPILESNQIVLYKELGAIRINSGAIMMDNVKVFDIRGRMIYEKKNINAAETTLNDLSAAQEVLLVQITSTDGRTVTKKAVN
jgi:large repetitive protein